MDNIEIGHHHHHEEHGTEHTTGWKSQKFQDILFRAGVTFLITYGGYIKVFVRIFF
jgi:hypothetical protein